MPQSHLYTAGRFLSSSMAFEWQKAFLVHLGRSTPSLGNPHPGSISDLSPLASGFPLPPLLLLLLDTRLSLNSSSQRRSRIRDCQLSLIACTPSSLLRFPLPHPPLLVTISRQHHHRPAQHGRYQHIPPLRLQPFLIVSTSSTTLYPPTSPFHPCSRALSGVGDSSSSRPLSIAVYPPPPFWDLKTKSTSLDLTGSIVDIKHHRRSYLR